MKGKITIPVKINHSKIPNKMHLDAQIMYPAKQEKDKSKFDRNDVKNKALKEIKEETK